MKTQKINTVLKVIYFIGLISLVACGKPSLQISKTTVEYVKQPVGVDLQNFRFGWQLASSENEVLQTKYQILLAQNEDDLSAKSALWNSGVVESDHSILVPYIGEKLNAGTEYFWKVKVWDNHGNESKWSQSASFITRLDSESDWADAKWIGMDQLPDDKRIVPGVHLPGGDKKWKYRKINDHKLPILRKEISVDKTIKQALVFISGMGHYEMFINGNKVGNSFLALGWTHYDDYAFYNTYDVTNMLSNGENALGVMLGNGFFIIPNERYRKLMTAYGNPQMKMKLQIEYSDGSIENVVSDESWKVTAGPITFSSIYGGETFNANLDQSGWKEARFDESNWKNAIVVNNHIAELRPETDYPVEITQSLETESITQIENETGYYLYDFGQNASGVISIQVQGNKGDTIHFYPAELITDDNRAEQRATGKHYYFTYVLNGDGVETWTPQFTYTGFRYVEVRGAKPASVEDVADVPVLLDMKLEHMHNITPRIGTFETSFELFNQIDDLIDWAIRSNMVSLLTDCPHREKLGWLEQLFLMGGSVHSNYDLFQIYNKQVDDMIAAQTKDGLVPDIAPEYVEFWEWFRDSPEWGSAAIQVPWLIYKWYGDTEVLERSWDMAARYCEYLRDTSVNHVIDHGLGDWYDLGSERPGIAQLTPRTVTGTAIHYSNVALMAEIATLLHKPEAHKYYAQWAEEIKKSFNDTFLDKRTNIYSTGSQTAISMPLELGLVDEKDKPAIFKTLVESIEKDNKALTAGDVGFHYLVKALQENGGEELLYEMNARDDVPGYGYQLKKGATALTESWAALPIVSNNHLMLGHINEWFYTGLGGIDQTENSVAYKHLLIEPQMVGKIENTNTSFETPYGHVKCDWYNFENEIELYLNIPVNSDATVVLPLKVNQQVKVNNELLSKDQYTIAKNGKIHFKLGSGNYYVKIN